MLILDGFLQNKNESSWMAASVIDHFKKVSSYIISLLPKKLNYRLTIYDFSQCKIEIHLIQFKNKHFKVLILSKSQKYY